MTYQRPSENRQADSRLDSQPATQTAEQPIQVDGFQQILEMLKIADPTFRESLLKRLAARDSTLARNLRRDLDR